MIYGKLGEYKDCLNKIIIHESVGGYFPVYYGECLVWDDDGTPFEWYSEELTFSRFATKQEAIDYVDKYYQAGNPEHDYCDAIREWQTNGG
tara:strand:+ start:155 stop:427 length:273 start_codon:yes stop_codon:yes gene_type:complete